MLSMVKLACVPALIVSLFGATSAHAAALGTTASPGARPAAIGLAAAAGPAVERLSGADRYSTSIAISSKFSPGVHAVYLASGANFPDGLSAATAAAKAGGPLLLMQPDSVPANIRGEITRLAPALIVVVGGTSSVSAAAYDQLSGLAPSIRRDGGTDRYETSRIVTQRAFPAGAASAYFATGADYPDALSASAAAGSSGSPVILVNGSAAATDSATDALIGTLGVQNATIVGGTVSISSGVEGSLTSETTVRRLAGTDRYGTSAAINRAAFTTAPRAYFAAGTGFADALSGAALASRDRAPLYVVQPTCVSSAVIGDLTSAGTTQRVLLGGTNSLGDGVWNLTPCDGGPSSGGSSGGGSGSSARQYPWHTGIASTTFWVGEIFDPNASDGSQMLSTYDSKWFQSYGGCDGASAAGKCSTQARTAGNGFFPTSMTPKENPFYLDLPFDDINNATARNSRQSVIPWAGDAAYAGAGTNDNISLMKNRWVRITANGQTCYGQIEDAGPGQYHDANYVFGTTDARPANGKFNGAGMDVSPALNGCLHYSELDGEDDIVSWKFVEASDVPAGPWTTLITTSGVR